VAVQIYLRSPRDRRRDRDASGMSGGGRSGPEFSNHIPPPRKDAFIQSTNQGLLFHGPYSRRFRGFFQHYGQDELHVLDIRYSPLATLSGPSVRTVLRTASELLTSMSAERRVGSECGLCAAIDSNILPFPETLTFSPPLLTAMLDDHENGGSGKYLFIGHRSGEFETRQCSLLVVPHPSMPA